MIKKCYSCGNIYLCIEHGNIYNTYYSDQHVCPTCGKSNYTKLKVDDLEGFIDYYKNDGLKFGYNIQKLEHILEIARMIEMLDKMRG
jgi:lysyl-tRNA synthetase class I